MHISWTQPGDDGGSPVIGYIVEYTDPSSNEWNRIKVKRFSHMCVVKGLKESRPYRFRVAAENKVGVGPFSEFSNDKMTYGKIYFILQTYIIAI